MGFSISSDPVLCDWLHPWTSSTPNATSLPKTLKAVNPIPRRTKKQIFRASQVQETAGSSHSTRSIWQLQLQKQFGSLEVWSPIQIPNHERSSTTNWSMRPESLSINAPRPLQFTAPQNSEISKMRTARNMKKQHAWQWVWECKHKTLNTMTCCYRWLDDACNRACVARSAQLLSLPLRIIEKPWCYSFVNHETQKASEEIINTRIQHVPWNLFRALKNQRLNKTFWGPAYPCCIILPSCTFSFLVFRS